MSHPFGGFTALLLLALLLGGCWDHIPVERSAFVTLLGIDADPNGTSRSVITYSIALPNALAAGATEAGQSTASATGTPFYLVSSTQETLQMAFSEAMTHVPRVVEFRHLRALVIGEDYAKSGVERVLEWAIRHPRVSTLAKILISRETAQVLLDAHPVLEPLPGNTVLSASQNTESLGAAFDTPVYVFTRALLSPRRDPAAPMVERVDPQESRAPPTYVQKPIAFTPESDKDSSRRNEIKIIGLAVFQNDRLAGVLSGVEMRGAAWIQGASTVSLTVPHPSLPNRQISVGLVNTRSAIKPTWTDGSLRIRIEIRGIGDILETGTLRPFDAGRQIEEIKAAVERRIERDIESAMARLQREFQADIFGVAELLYRKEPAVWKRLSPEWRKVYAAAALEVDVSIKMGRTGLAR